ncbi:hypothetical protein [Alistipes indistinctus]|uniref:hypothetical protein n=1 Tax=Alistipes indistinctus TaxID=626932 RepID=UPI0026762E5E|nr:hypothetical protein [Alistipes indistinctus]
MALPKKPDPIIDVQRALGESSSNIKVLCCSDKVNMFSYYKPVDSGSYHDPDTDWPANVKQNFGINIPALTLPVDTSLNWTRDKPTGGRLSPYNLHDFGGYEHTARPCLSSGCTGTVSVNMSDTGYTTRTFTFEQIPASSKTNVSALNMKGIQYYYWGFALLTSLTATEGKLITCDKTIGEGGNSITVDFFEIGAGTHHKYMLFVLSKKKSTWTNQDEWNISDLEVDPLVVYHNSTFINPVPLNIFNSILISAKMTGINTDGAKYTFYPFSNFTSSPLQFYGQYAYVKVTITNIAEHEVRYTTLQEVEVVSFWGTVEKGTPLVLDATTGNRVSMIVLAAGESRDYVLEIEQFAWHNGEFQLDNYPTGVVNSYIKLGFGELLDQTGTFQIQARNI